MVNQQLQASCTLRCINGHLFPQSVTYPQFTVTFSIRKPTGSCCNLAQVLLQLTDIGNRVIITPVEREKQLSELPGSSRDIKTERLVEIISLCNTKRSLHNWSVKLVRLFTGRVNVFCLFQFVFGWAEWWYLY